MEIYYQRRRIVKRGLGVGRSEFAEDIYILGSNPLRIRIKPYAEAMPCTREEIKAARAGWHALKTLEIPQDFLERLVLNINRFDPASRIFGADSPSEAGGQLEKDLAEANRMIREQTRPQYGKKKLPLLT